MSRMVQRSVVLAAGFVGLVLAFGPAQASMSRGDGPARVGSATVVSDVRLACRPVRTARRRVRTYRPMIADARPFLVDPGPYEAPRYVSLLVLGVGY